MEHNNNSINKQIGIHVVSNSFHKVQQSMSGRLKVPVYVPLDATTTSEHSTQGLNDSIRTLDSHFKFKKEDILPIALHTEVGTVGFISLLFYQHYSNRPGVRRFLTENTQM